MKYLLLSLFYSAVCKRHKAFLQQSNCMYLRQYRLQFHKLRTTQVCSLLQLCQCKLLHNSENFVWKTIACSCVCDETKASVKVVERARARKQGIFTSLMKRHGLTHSPRICTVVSTLRMPDNTFSKNSNSCVVLSLPNGLP